MFLLQIALSAYLCNFCHYKVWSSYWPTKLGNSNEGIFKKLIKYVNKLNVICSNDLTVRRLVRLTTQKFKIWEFHSNFKLFASTLEIESVNLPMYTVKLN